MITLTGRGSDHQSSSTSSSSVHQCQLSASVSSISDHHGIIANDNPSLISKSTSFSSQRSLPSLPSLLYSHPSSGFPFPSPSPPSLCHCTSTLTAHSSYVSALALALAFYPSNTLLISCSPDQTLKLWHTSTNLNDLSTTLIASVLTKSPVKSILVSKDRIIFTSHHDGKIRAWSANLKEKHPKLLLLAVLPTLKDRFFSILSPHKYIQVRRHKHCTWVNHADAVSALALSHDGKFLYSASWDRTFKVWRTCSFKCIESISRAHEDAINAIVVSKDSFIYTGSADMKIKSWAQLPGKKKHSLVSTMEQHKSAVNALVLSEDGSVLYSGACDRSVVVWQGCSGQMTAIGALRGHKNAVLCLAVNRNVLCSGSADKTIRVWSRETEGAGYSYSCLAVLEGHAGAVKSLAIMHWDDFSDNESELIRDHKGQNNGDTYVVYSGGMDCEIKAWKLLLSKQAWEI